MAFTTIASGPGPGRSLRKRLGCLLLAGLVAALSPCAHAKEVTYHLTILPPNSGDFSWVQLVNDPGHGVIWVPGEYEDPTEYAFWSPKTGYKWLDYVMYPEAMNNNDEVVGGVGNMQAGIWTPDNGIVDRFSIPDGYRSMYISSINDDGLVVGYVVADDGIPHSFHRLRNQPAVVDHPEQGACALAVNQKGDVMVQKLEEGAAYCDCPDTLGLEFVHDGQRVPVRLPHRQAACIVGGLDADGDAAVYSEDTQTFGLWSPVDGYAPIRKKEINVIGVADRGIVFGRARHDNFVWDRANGMRWLRQLTDPKDRDNGFEVRSVSPKGVLGGAGNGGWDAAILVPSRD